MNSSLINYYEQLTNPIDSTIQKISESTPIIGNSYTVTPNDSGKILSFEDTGPITLTFDANVWDYPEGFNIIADVANGTGTITPQVAGPIALSNPDGHTTIKAGGSASLFISKAGIVKFIGTTE